MKGSTVALIGLGVAGAGGAIWWYLHRQHAGGAQVDGGTAISASRPVPAGSSFAQSAANILANKAGTKALCQGVSKIYTGGAASGACSTVANIANKLTVFQVKATVAVAKKTAAVAKTVVVDAGKAVSSVGHAIASLF